METPVNVPPVDEDFSFDDAALSAIEAKGRNASIDALERAKIHVTHEVQLIYLMFKVLRTPNHSSSGVLIVQSIHK